MSFAILLIIVNGASVANAKSSGLKVKVKISYAVKPQKKCCLINYFAEDNSFDKRKKIELSSEPKSVSIKFPKGAIGVGKEFGVCIDDFKLDDSYCTNNNVNHGRKLEVVKIDFGVGE